jgi:hypothetical protein
MPDQWPDDFGRFTVTPPITILREQAAILGKKTRGAVEGLVTTSKEADGFAHYFYVVAPSLDNYTYRLFAVTHAVQLYPVVIHAEVMQRSFQAATEEEFVEHLRSILSSEQTKKVIQAIRAQVEVPAS